MTVSELIKALEKLPQDKQIEADFFEHENEVLGVYELGDVVVLSGMEFPSNGI